MSLQNKGQALSDFLFTAASNLPSSTSNKSQFISTIKAISKAIAKTNRPFFQQKLQAEFSSRDMHVEFEEIVCCSKKEGEKPFKDSLGRVTFFKVRLAGQEIPVYQPGTAMFESAVGNDSPLAVYHNNACQNGPLLGNSCALFLARFLSRLAHKYKRECLKQLKDSRQFYPELYELALTKCLTSMCVEDANEHGRLLTVKDRLMEIGMAMEPGRRKAIEVLFLASDVKKMNKVEKDVSVEEILALTKLHQDPTDIEAYREMELFYPNKDIQKGEVEMERVLEMVKNSLLQKKGIVPPEQEENFYKNVKTMIDNMIIHKDTFKSTTSSKPKISPKPSTDSQSSHTFSSKDTQKLPSNADSDEEEEKKEPSPTLSREDLYISNLDRCQPLFFYFQHLSTGLKGILLSAEIYISDVFIVNSSCMFSECLKLSGELVPEIGKVLVGIGVGVEKVNEHLIKERLAKIKASIPCGKADQVIELISRRVTLMKREYVAQLTWKKVEEQMTNLKKLQKFFQKKDPYQFLAAMDLKLIEAIILKMDTKEIQKIYHKQDFCEKFSSMVCSCFKQKQLYEMLSSSKLKQGELPPSIEIKPSLQLPAKFFCGPYALPEKLRTVKYPSEQQLEEKVRLCLGTMTDKTFEQVGKAIDPTRPEERRLEELYSEVQLLRMSRGTEKKTCAVF